MNENTLYQLTGVDIIQLIKNRSVTTVDIARSFIARTQALNPIIHAWKSVHEGYVIQQAHHLNKLCKTNMAGLLLGVPIGIKDIFNTEFYPTQKGTPIWENYKAGNDARCVAYLRRENAIIFGKTDTAELAVHANGKSLNPHNLAHVTGSSSGGSAAAVATAMVPVALGSQTGGSIIRPASWCGVYAMKPSFGLIPRTGILKTTDTLDTVGFFTRCAADMSLLLETMRVRGDNFPIQEQKIKSYRDSINKKKWRVAFCNHPIIKEAHSYVHDELEKFKNGLSKLDRIEVFTLDLPESTTHWNALHRRIYHPCLAYYLKTESSKEPDKISSILRAIFDDAKTIPPEDYEKALNEQEKLASDLEDFFSTNKIDVILTNSSNGSAPYMYEPEFHKDLNALWTMAWLPVINVPKFSCQQGLPFGLHLVGPRYSDYKLLAFLEYLCEREAAPYKSKIVTLPGISKAGFGQLESIDQK
ncbi:MAG: hypothetical protein A3F11_03085 [Gammaproteobacteria bacterium RIFCSPHIGHO2_12_FULL_37_14]|nr:MAG: hypothetical protein A3F11_03085 [Gammaproteobacteria bacterium RIFCSPHIGHO2_12_FULL_37_14]